MIASRRVHVLVCYKKEIISEHDHSTISLNSDVQNDPGHANCAMKADLSNCILTIIIQIIQQKCLQLRAYTDLHVQSFRPHIIWITILDPG